MLCLEELAVVLCEGRIEGPGHRGARGEFIVPRRQIFGTMDRFERLTDTALSENRLCEDLKRLCV